MLRVKRRISAMAAIALLVAVAAGCSSGTDDAGDNKRPMTVAYSAAIAQANKVPIHMALEKLKADGHKTDELYSQTPADAVQAVVQGEVDFGTAATSTVFAAIKQGAPIKAIMSNFSPAYVFVTGSSIADAGGLDGKRVGIQGKISSTALYTDLAMTDYPGAKPKILVVPGSANRVAAMLAGELDASVIDFAEWLKLDSKEPGKFHVIYDVAEEHPELMDGVMFATTSLLKSQPEHVTTFLSAVQDTYKSIYEDSSDLVDAITEIVPDTSPEDSAALTKAMVAAKIWPLDGGMSSKQIAATLDVFLESGLLTTATAPTAAECCDATLLRDAG